MSPTVDMRKRVENAGDGIIASDQEGIIVLWDPAAERTFGYTKVEASD